MAVALEIAHAHISTRGTPYVLSDLADSLRGKIEGYEIEHRPQLKLTSGVSDSKGFYA